MGEKLKESKIPEELVFIWIGCATHHVDKIANVLGTNLAKKYRIRSMFCNGQNIEEVKQMCIELRKDKTRKFQFIAIDVGFCITKSIMVSVKGGIKPASAVKEQKIFLGDIGYIININKVYKHVKGMTEMECLLNNYTDKKVTKEVNRIIRRVWVKLEEFLAKLEEVSL